MGRFMSKPPKDNQSYLRDEEWLVFGKLANKPLKLSPRTDPVSAWTSSGCPRPTGEPRAPSLVVGSSNEQKHGVGRGHKGVVVVKRSIGLLDVVNQP
jgi:hypothetical protein